MLSIIFAAVAWTLSPLDEAWARLAHDAAAHDAYSFSANRAEIVRLYKAVMTRWGAKQREEFKGPDYTVTTYTGPTRVPGDRWHSAYFALVSPSDDLRTPTFWEVTPAFSPNGGAIWFLSVSSCDLASGDPIEGHPRSWHTSGVNNPPAYETFKADVAALAGTPRAFPADTSVAHSPGTTCLQVGHLDTPRLLPLGTVP